MEVHWKTIQSEASVGSLTDVAAASGDWRTQLHPEGRQKIVNAIMETLKRHLPMYIHEDLNELRKIAICFEENICSAAISQSDYLGKIYLNVLSMETKTQQTALINPAMTNAGAVNQNPADTGLHQQQQLLGTLFSISNMHPHKQAILRQKNAAHQHQQRQTQRYSSSLLQSQGRQSQHQSQQQHHMSQCQPQLRMQQANPLQLAMQQIIQGSGPLLQAQNAMEQKPFIQTQRGLPEVSSSTSMESTDQTGVMDWQEECYQKIKSMKEQYFAELTEFHQKIDLKLLQQEALIPPGKHSEHHEKLKSLRTIVERMLAFLQINKNKIAVGMKEKLPVYEKKILNIVAAIIRIGPHVQGQRQFQHPNVGNAHPIQQKQPYQVSQLQLPDNHANQSQVNNTGQSLAIQSPLPQNLKNNTSADLPGSSGMCPLPSMAGHGQSNISGVSHASNLQNISGIPHGSVNSSMARGAQPDMYANPQRRIQGGKSTDPVSEKGSPEDPTFSHRICIDCSGKRQEPTFSCPICMGALASPISTLCGHIFCEVCIIAAIKRRKECPTCRTKLRGRNYIHRVYLPTVD